MERNWVNMINSISSNYSLPDMETVRQNRFKKADADGDGKITKYELTAVIPQKAKGPGVDEIFSKADTNGDGTIDQTEDKAAFEQMQKTRPAGGQPDPTKMASDLFKLVDTDTDGKITKDELTEVLSQGNGNLSVDDIFKTVDGDEDGTITESELSEALKGVFEKTQANPPPPPPDGNATEGYDRTGNSRQASLLNLFSAVA